MTIEQRLSEALHSADDFQPSPDLFARVERSIEEDRAHRRRVLLNIGLGLLALAVTGLYLTLVISPGRNGRVLIPNWALEILETVVMVGLTLILGPSIRRFGRNYIEDIFRAGVGTGHQVLKLLDVAYYLVFSGVVLLGVNFTNLDLEVTIQRGLELSVFRLAVFLLTMGLIHALTLTVLPAVGLVYSSLVWRSERARLGPGAPDPSREAALAERVVKIGTTVLAIVVGILILIQLVALIGIGLG